MHSTVAVHSPYVHVATIEYEAELRHKNEMARVAAEIQGKYELVCMNLLYVMSRLTASIASFPGFPLFAVETCVESLGTRLLHLHTCMYLFYIVHDTAT